MVVQIDELRSRQALRVALPCLPYSACFCPTMAVAAIVGPQLCPLLCSPLSSLLLCLPLLCARHYAVSCVGSLIVVRAAVLAVRFCARRRTCTRVGVSLRCKNENADVDSQPGSVQMLNSNMLSTIICSDRNSKSCGGKRRRTRGLEDELISWLKDGWADGMDGYSCLRNRFRRIR
jgi:hypothetical protein